MFYPHSYACRAVIQTTRNVRAITFSPPETLRERVLKLTVVIPESDKRESLTWLIMMSLNFSCESRKKLAVKRKTPSCSGLKTPTMIRACHMSPVNDCLQDYRTKSTDLFCRNSTRTDRKRAERTLHGITFSCHMDRYTTIRINWPRPRAQGTLRSRFMLKFSFST